MADSAGAAGALIDDAVAQLVSGEAGAAAACLERFARHALANLPADDLAGETAENLARALRSFWDFAAQRRPGRPKLRLSNPPGRARSETVLEMVNDDMPFLVDSVAAELQRQGLEVRLLVHPVFVVQRDPDGRLQDIDAPGPRHAGRAESMMQLRLAPVPVARHAALAERLLAVLADVRAAVQDWRAMRHRARDLIEELEGAPPPLPRQEVEEALALLDWLDSNNFTYLGYREYEFAGEGTAATSRIVEGSGLGLLQDPAVSVFDGLRNLGALPAEVQAFIRAPVLLRFTKANLVSTVHRAVPLDTLAVKRFDAEGRVVGERLFVGLLTATAYSESPREIPLLRRKVAATLQRAGFHANSHDGKAMQHILESFPRDELFQIGEDDLYRTAIGILHLQERHRLALFVRHDPFERFVSALVFVPRDRFDTALRHRLQAMLAEAYQGEVTAHTTHMSDAPLARLHVIVATRQGEVPKVDEEALEVRMAAAARSWPDAVAHAVETLRGEVGGHEAAQRWCRAFPPGYQGSFRPEQAADDLPLLEAVDGGQPFAVNLYLPPAGGGSALGFKVVVADSPVPLSDILPVLENLGLRVISEVPYRISPSGRDKPLWMHDFELQTRLPQAIDLALVRDKFHDAFTRVWDGRLESDGLNRLVLRARLAARQVGVLRAYLRYLRQVQAPFGQEYMEQTLSGNPEIARGLLELFEVRFDPALPGDRAAAESEVEARLHGLLDEVASLDEDRILRRFLNLVQSTVRTNFYQGGDGRGPEEPGAEKQHLALKFDSQRIEGLPAPRPFREIFVYSPRLEAVHLRFGRVARGGLRWSDRREDFRTEILGLAKAQQVKNAVIVPVGAKGGFVLKNPPPPAAGRDALQQEGVACYRTFLRGLLDVTDNLENGRVVPPNEVVRHDGDDPYLVVAADKGTATFSDYANAVSGDYGFWLGDAFASGGSAGYDHKAMGITARGAWESVKRHFRELGKDIQAEDFTCVGVGDMAGDVFGNGMLLTPHLRLLGAFNHLHVFVDPDPDPQVSLAERRRLFELPRSTWADYDAKLISKGGGVFDRKAKSIQTTPEMRAAFGLVAESVTPAELIRALLSAPVELLWFGGIGTFVKAAAESHVEVGDRANDALRVDGGALKAKVVGEGANLGMTQRGRIEYCLAGGRCNTDAIDNSAGVDCSDHEVNIKILTGMLERGGRLARPERDRLLVAMTDEVAALVLRDNYLQTQAISVTQHLGVHLLDREGRFMRVLEKAGLLDRALEFLPDDEALADRQAKRQPLTRPELAILLSYAKISLARELLASDLPDDAALEGDLLAYFPKPLQDQFGDAIVQHPLRREIVATGATNSIVNRMGPTFVLEQGERTGLPAGDLVRAWLAARKIFLARRAWHGVEALDGKVPTGMQAALLVEVSRLLEQGTTWLLRQHGRELRIQETVQRYAPGVAEMTAVLDEVLTAPDRALREQRAAPWREAGVPEPLALLMAAAPWRAAGLDVVRIASDTGRPVKAVAACYFAVGGRFGFDWLRRAAAKLGSDTVWDKLAVSAVIEDLGQQQAEMTRRILDSDAGGDGLEAFAEARRPLVARASQLLGELAALPQPSLAMLTVASRQLRSLLAA